MHGHIAVKPAAPDALTHAPAMIKRAHWNILSDCNLPCGFCYLWRRPNISPFDTESSFALIEALSAHVKQMVFGGGDPLMRTDIVELVRFAKQRHMHIELHTNAVMFRDVDWRELLSNLDRLGLSFDGESADVHDRMRGATGNFHQCLDALHEANSFGVPTTIRTLVTKRNVGRIKGLAEILRNYACIEKWSIRQFTPLGRGSKTRKAYDMSDFDFAKEFDEIVDHARAVAPSLTVQKVTHDDMANCYCLITEDGTFYSHPVEGDYRSAGKYPDLPVEQILQGMTYDRSARP